MHPHHLLRKSQALLRGPGRLTLVVLVALVVGAGCSAPDEARVAVAPTLVEDGPRELRILRADYERVIKEGLQPVMRWYLTMPAYDASEKFLGFRIVRILKTEFKDGPVKVGDVLRRINGRPIETPGDAETIWRELWARKTLTLSMIREDRPMDLTIPIVSPDADTAPTN